MLHAKFQNHRPSGSEEEEVFAIYNHSGHLGYLDHLYKLSFPLPNDATHKV